MFLRNYWYVAAWADEVSRAPMGRIICNEPILLFRKQDGSVVALEDRCCHRRVPLHIGAVIGDTIQCGYHGFTYDETGKCIRVPGQDIVPPQARVKSYPVVERDTMIWVWLGDADKVDESKIVDYHWFNDPGWGAKSTRFHVKGNYQLIVENLLDLTHIAFVHTSTIGNSALVDKAKVDFERKPNEVNVTRWMIDTPAPPTYVKAGGFTTNVDRWQIINFTPPGFVRLYTGAAQTGTGAPEGNRVGGIGLRNLNIITPETETTSHYFWGQAQDVKPNDPETTDLVFEQVKEAFLQDVAVFEKQQANINLDPSAPEVDVMGDTGSLHSRRILRRLLDEEAAAGVS
jgi:phenylpropionate dioxygenase-like ring-hydroxylating dioxygenase large terminal subunit